MHDVQGSARDPFDRPSRTSLVAIFVAAVIFESIIFGSGPASARRWHPAVPVALLVGYWTAAAYTLIRRAGDAVRRDGERVILRIALWRRVAIVAVVQILFIVAWSWSAAERVGWAIFLALGSVLMWWLTRERVVVDDGGVEYRGLRAPVTLRWSEIAHTEVSPAALVLVSSTGKRLTIANRWLEGFRELAAAVAARVPHTMDEPGLTLLRRQAAWRSEAR